MNIIELTILINKLLVVLVCENEAHARMLFSLMNENGFRIIHQNRDKLEPPLKLSFTELGLETNIPFDKNLFLTNNILKYITTGYADACGNLIELENETLLFPGFESIRT